MNYEDIKHHPDKWMKEYKKQTDKYKSEFSSKHSNVKEWENFYDKFTKNYEKLSCENKRRMCDTFLHSSCKPSVPKNKLGKLKHQLEDFLFNVEVTGINYEKEFERVLTNLRIGIIIIIILLSIVYQINYREELYSKTFFNVPQYRARLFKDMFFTFIFTFLGSSFVWWSRTGYVGSYNQMSTSITISTIFTLFVLGKELSGYNRWLAQDETINGKGPYSDIDEKDIDHKPQKEEYDFKDQGDPFIVSLGWFSFIFTTSILVIFFLKMLYVSYNAYKYGDCNIKNISFILGREINSTDNIYLLFLIELFILVLFNSLSFNLSPFIRGEIINWKKLINIGVIILVILYFQLSFQWTGLLPSKRHHNYCF
jgi:hypothetical protein